jgi:hypothetical protein
MRRGGRASEAPTRFDFFLDVPKSSGIPAHFRFARMRVAGVGGRRKTYALSEAAAVGAGGAAEWPTSLHWRATLFKTTPDAPLFANKARAARAQRPRQPRGRVLRASRARSTNMRCAPPHVTETHADGCGDA